MDIVFFWQVVEKCGQLNKTKIAEGGRKLRYAVKVSLAGGGGLRRDTFLIVHLGKIWGICAFQSSFGYPSSSD